jgi:hypothetical protein
MKTKKCDADHCQSNASFNNYCGAYVCWSCDTHIGLARCYCGWSRYGDDGRKELEDMGETIDPEPDAGNDYAPGSGSYNDMMFGESPDY